MLTEFKRSFQCPVCSTYPLYLEDKQCPTCSWYIRQPDDGEDDGRKVKDSYEDDDSNLLD